MLSISKGLTEAGLAIGLPRWRRSLSTSSGRWRSAGLFRLWATQFIVSLKDTSLFIVIGVGELTRTGQGNHGRGFPGSGNLDGGGDHVSHHDGFAVAGASDGSGKKRMRILMSDAIIQFRNVVQAFRPASRFLMRLIWTLCHKGEVVVLVGPSGSGKSTLFALHQRVGEDHRR